MAPKLAAAAAWAAALLLQGCYTMTPQPGLPSQGMSAILVQGRFSAMGGEEAGGSFACNLESDFRSYRLRVQPGRVALFSVDPGSYYLYPPRTAFGAPRPDMEVVVAGRRHRIPFPREILRREPIVLKPGKAWALGMLVVQEQAGRGGEERVRISLDERPEIRRRLIQDKIRELLDPRTQQSERDNTVAWVSALEQALVQLQSKGQDKPYYKPGDTQ